MLCVAFLSIPSRNCQKANIERCILLTLFYLYSMYTCFIDITTPRRRIAFDRWPKYKRHIGFRFQYDCDFSITSLHTSVSQRYVDDIDENKKKTFIGSCICDNDERNEHPCTSGIICSSDFVPYRRRANWIGACNRVWYCGALV